MIWGRGEVKHCDIAQWQSWKSVTSCPLNRLFSQKNPVTWRLLPNLRFSLWRRCPGAWRYQVAVFAISGHAACLSCQLSYLRVSTPERRLVLCLRASDIILIFCTGYPCSGCAEALWHDPYIIAYCVSLVTLPWEDCYHKDKVYCFT